MRNCVFSLLTALSLAACSSGTTYVVRQAPPVPVEPLEITLGRPHGGQLFVQTNRPAYIAIFEVIPERGVTIVHPTTSRQRRHVVSGLDRIPLWWEPGRTTAAGRPARGEPMRYIYAIASDRPLRLTDDAFEPGYFQRTMGIDGQAAAASPYAAMRAISRRFVATTVREEAWAEDVVVHGDPRVPHSTRIARVYCADGTVVEVPVDMAERVLCPVRSGGAAPRKPAQPDSVKTETGERVAVGGPQRLPRGPGSRIGEPEGDRRGAPVRGGLRQRPAPPPQAADAGTPQRATPGVVPVVDRPGNGAGRPENAGQGQPGNQGRGQECRPDVPGEPPCRPVTPGANAPGRPANPGAAAPGRRVTPPAATPAQPDSARSRPAGPAGGAVESETPPAARPTTPAPAQARPAQPAATPPARSGAAPARAGQPAAKAAPAADSAKAPAGKQQAPIPADSSAAAKPPAADSTPSKAAPAAAGNRPAAAGRRSGRP